MENEHHEKLVKSKEKMVQKEKKRLKKEEVKLQQDELDDEDDFEEELIEEKRQPDPKTTYFEQINDMAKVSHYNNALGVNGRSQE